MTVFKKNSNISGLIFFLSFFFFISSCTVVKNYPQKQPFIYQTNVHVEGEFSDDQRKELALQLGDQLHDNGPEVARVLNRIQIKYKPVCLGLLGLELAYGSNNLIRRL